MRVLVACEFSGVVREAFIRRGHQAVSCDLLPEANGYHDQHIQGDVRGVLDRGWDLIIAHPPCTYLANSGVRWLYGGKGTTKDPDRWAAMEAGAAFMRMIWDTDCPKLAIENPIQHRYAQILACGKPDQIIQPWQFGHPETKATCLWLRNLPPLQPTKIVEGRTPRVHHESPGPDRWKRRSQTYTGIAAAMAAQWG